MTSSLKVILIGMPGSGKSTFGRQLAHELGLSFYDLDEEIERAEGNKIAQIFKSHGEDYFRELEESQLVSILSKKESLVLSSGGGTPCFNNGIDTMLQSGVVFYLYTPLEKLINRLEKNISERPLLKGVNLTEKLEDLYSTRAPYYEQAQFTINNSDSVIEEVKNILEKESKA